MPGFFSGLLEIMFVDTAPNAMAPYRVNQIMEERGAKKMLYFREGAVLCGTIVW
jgi:hypothetical protein